MDLAVPTFVLQPLVENAVRHGSSPERGVRVEVRARAGPESLVLEITDNGPGWKSPHLREGTGLRVTRARLKHLYGSADCLTWGNREGGGAAVTVRIPRHAPSLDGGGAP